MKSCLRKTLCGTFANYCTLVINAANGSGDGVPISGEAVDVNVQKRSRSLRRPGGLALACGPVAAMSATQQYFLDAVCRDGGVPGFSDC